MEEQKAAYYFAAERFKVMADHYHRGVEVGVRLWQQRNARFLWLIVAVSLAVVFTYAPDTVGPSMVRAIALWLNQNDPETLRAIAGTFPYIVLHSLLLVAVYYSMVNVFLITANINRNYHYLALLERDIRNEMALHHEHTAYSWESRFYDRIHVPMQGWIKYFYAGLIGTLLVLFAVFRVTSDWASVTAAKASAEPTLLSFLQTHFLLIADVCLLSATLLAFVGFLRISLRPPKPGSY